MSDLKSADKLSCAAVVNRQDAAFGGGCYSGAVRRDSHAVQLLRGLCDGQNRFRSSPQVLL